MRLNSFFPPGALRGVDSVLADLAPSDPAAVRT